MAESGGIRAGRAYVELGVNDKVAAGLARVGSRFKAWGAGIRAAGLGLSGLGAAITGPLILAAKLSAESGAAIYEMSKRTGISVERLSVLGYAAQQSGSDLETFEKSVRLMQKSLTGTDDEMEGTSKALEHLHASAAEFAGMSPDQQFELVAKKINLIKDPTERAAVAMRVFGRSGTAMLPMIENLGELERRGKVFERSTESAKAGKAFVEAMNDAARATKSLWGALASGIIPLLQKKAEWITRVTLIARDWAKQNKNLVVLIFEVAFAVGLAGTALVVLGATFSAVGTIIGGVATLFGTLWAILAAASSPITIITVGLVGLGASLMLLTETGREVFDFLAGGFERLRSDATKAFAGITDALAAGNFALAAKILWATLRLEWERGIAVLNKLWIGFKQTFLTVFYGAVYGAQAFWEDFQHSIQSAWSSTVGFLTRTWTNFAANFQNVWEKTQHWLSDLWLDLMGQIGELDPAQVDAAKAGNAKQSQDNLANIEKERSAALAAIEAEQSARRAGQEQQHADNMAKIGQEYAAAIKAADVAGDTGEVDRLREELNLLLQQAAAERAAAAAKKSETVRTGAGAGLDDVVKKISAAGSFSSAAAFGMGGDALQSRIARATEETAKNTRNRSGGGKVV